MRCVNSHPVLAVRGFERFVLLLHDDGVFVTWGRPAVEVDGARGPSACLFVGLADLVENGCCLTGLPWLHLVDTLHEKHVTIPFNRVGRTLAVVRFQSGVQEFAACQEVGHSATDHVNSWRAVSTLSTSPTVL